MAGLRDTISKALAGFRGSTSVAATATAGSASEDGLWGNGYLISHERSAALQGKRRYQRYQEIVTNTLIVAASVRYFLLLLASAKWTVQPPKDADGNIDPKAQEVADFVQDVMDDMNTSWSGVIRHAGMFRFNGFSIQEWTAKKRSDGRIGILDLERRPCSTIERWDLDAGNSVQGVTQMINGREEVYLPRGKIVYLVDDALSSSPDGMGLFRHVVRPSERLRAYEELEELAFETDLRGTPIGWAPLRELRDQVTAGRMTPAQAARARKVVDDFVKNRLKNKNKSAVLDSETYLGTTADGGQTPSSVRKYGVEIMQGTAQGESEAAAAINRINKEMAVLLGTEHLLLGTEGTGSLALSRTKQDSFFLVVNSTNNEIAEGFNRDYVGTVCRLNGIDEALWPKLQPEDVDTMAMQEVCTALASLATAGATLAPDDPAIDVLRGNMGLPPQPEMPELSEEDQALVDRVRMGIPVQVAVPSSEAAPNEAGQGGKPGAGSGSGSGADQTVKPGANQDKQRQSIAKMAIAALLPELLRRG